MNKTFLLGKFAGLVIVGTRNGYFGEEEHGQIIQDIRESDADVLFIGMPSPFKEAWCHRHKEDLGVPVQVGVGGSFDVIAGYIKRAPRWMQKIGMEWAWRLMMEPRRLWKRYLTSNSMFIWLTLQTFFSRRTPSSR